MLDLTIVQSPGDLDAVLTVRRRVFIEEQGVSEHEEIDSYDVPEALGVHAVYVLGALDGEPVATGRLLLDHVDDGLPHIGRVAVLSEHRGSGYGRAVMDALHAEARARGFRGVTLAAQMQALGFYEHLGYMAHGPVFLDAGIEHRQADLLFG